MKLPSLKIDTIVVLIAAIATVLLIKSTSLLPASLYFQFSRAFSSDLGAFLVPKPTMEARQYCQLARAKGYSRRSCPGEPGNEDRPLTAKDKQLIIQAVIEQRQSEIVDGRFALRQTSEIDEAGLLQQISIDLSFRDDLDDYISKRAGEIASVIADSFVGEVRSRFEQQAGVDDELDVAVVPRETEVDEDLVEDSNAAAENEGDTPSLLANAEQLLNQQLAVGIAVNDSRFMRIDTLSDLLRGNLTEWVAFDRINQYFVHQISPLIQSNLQNNVLKSGLNVRNIRNSVEHEVINEVGYKYITAIAIRLLIPFICGAVLVILLGGNTRNSIAVGCALSAFLLAWPIALLWDGVVEQPYKNLRGAFLAFYAAYVASFFTMSYLGATVAAILRRKFAFPSFAEMEDSPSQLGAVGTLARELPYQVALNLATNGATLALSFAFFGSDIGYES